MNDLRPTSPDVAKRFEHLTASEARALALAKLADLSKYPVDTLAMPTEYHYAALVDIQTACDEVCALIRQIMGPK